MSYRGRPSKGCESCRARKVKCDEKKPTCSRCVKSNLDCKYRDQGDLLFRNQTASAAQRAEESWRKRSKSNQRAVSEGSTSNTSPPSNLSPPSYASPPSEESSPSAVYQWNAGGQQSHHSSPHGSTEEQPHATFDASAPLPDLASMRITPEKEPDLRNLAFERFFHDFIALDSPNRPAGEPADAVWSFIPIIYQAAAENSCYRTVVDAVAYVNYANRCKAPQAMALAEDSMARGINLISKMVADKKLAATDETLGSVYLLAVYENMTTVQRKGTFIAHQHGANALLQLRTIKQFYSNPVSAKLYDVAYCQMLLANLQAAKKPPLPMEDTENVDNLHPRLYGDHNAYVIRLIWREANVHAKWHDVKRSSTLPASRLDLWNLLQTALDLDAAFQAWNAEVPPAWRYQVDLNMPEQRMKYEAIWQKLFLDGDDAPGEIHSYADLKQCWIWGFYRTTWLFLLRDILEMINWMLRLPMQIPGTAINDTTENIYEPVHLDDMTLQIQYSITTVHLVNLVETNCAAIMNNFTVPVNKKEDGDISGMRGYLCLWPLGIMDAILGSGLIPDSNDSFITPEHQYTPQVSPYTHIRQQVPIILATPPQETLSTSLDSYASAPQFSELSKLPPKPPSGRSPSPHPSATRATIHPSQPSSLVTETARKGHIFDSSPARPFDQPFDQLRLDPSHSINIAGRREWINTILYYIASELGIKKALYIPVTEGFIQRVKPKLDDILGR